MRARRRALAGAGRADHSGVDCQLLRGTERALRQVDVDPDTGVPAPPGPAPRPGDPRRERAGAGASGRGERVGSHVIHLPLARVGELLIGLGDLLEPLLGLRVWIDIRMQLPGQPPVGLLDLVRTRVVSDAEDGVVIVRHLHPYDSARIWPTYRATARTAPIAVG